MKLEEKQKWVEALRSGKYKQGKHNLRDKEDRFCCLGVLCDIVDPQAWALTEDKSRYAHRVHNIALLNHKIREDLKLKVEHETHLMSMNDSGESFETIANYIEKEV